MVLNAPVPDSLLQRLQQPSPPSCRKEQVDFKTLGFSRNVEAFALLIHNLLTSEECDELRHAAETAAEGKWEQALIDMGGHQVLMTSVRTCDRIMWDTPEVADALLARIRPHLPSNISTPKDSPNITRDEETWELTRLNERLRFLRYQPGMYFRKYSDANYITPDESEVSFLTVHIYLKGSEDLKGGCTRFFGKIWPGPEETYDVDPSPGTCLIFQHRGLIHSGEDVLQGTKYTVRTDVLYRRPQ